MDPMKAVGWLVRLTKMEQPGGVAACALLSVGAGVLWLASSAYAEASKPEVLFSSSAAELARSVTDALLVPGYELKEVVSQVALDRFCDAGSEGKQIIVLSTVEMASHVEEKCGGGRLVKAELGYATLVLVQKATDPPMSLSAKQIYLGLAEMIPLGKALAPNKSQKWSEVDAELPDLPIMILLPGEQDKLRHIFDAEVLVGGCRNFPVIRKIVDAETRSARCLKLRVGMFVDEKTEAESLVELKSAGPGAVAFVTDGEHLYRDKDLRIVPFNGMLPTPEDIVAEDYTLTVPIYLYVHAEQMSVHGGSEAIRAWVLEALSERAIGENGYSEQFGFTSVPAATRDWQRRAYSE